MADQKLSQLTASGALTGAELAYVVQAGNSRRTTTGAIAELAPGTSLTYDPATRLLGSSTGGDVTLPLAGAEAGLISAVDQAKLTSIVVDRARLTVADVRNNSGVSIPKGSPVYVTGSSGTTKTVALADASLEATAANTLGLAADTIANNSDGLVITEGPLTGLNTAGLAEGQLIWLSETTGAITSTRPTQPAHGVVLGWCVKTGAGSAGILYVKVDNGLELNELHDVLITSPATGQVLRRAADGLWKNAALAAGDVMGLAAVATSGAYGDLSGRPSLGTAAAGTIGTAAGNVVALDGSARLPAVDGSQLTGLPSAPVTSVAGRTGAVTLAVGDVANAVATNDARLSDARTPLAHTQAWSTITGTPTTLSGYGITDAFNPAIPGAIGGTTPAAGSFTRLTLPAQGSAPTAPATGFTFYANSSNALSWVGANGFIRTFDGTANTANRTYTLPDASGTLALLGDAISSTTTRLANVVLAGPTTGAAAAPTFRALVAADLPAVTYSQHSTLTAVSSTYTLDATAFNEFTASAAIASNITITCSNLSSVPSGQVWRAVFRFAYTSGAVTFGAPAGVTTKADVPSLSSSRTYDVVVRYIGGGTTIGYQISRGEPT